ncbi:MAG: biopolymer transporter ExbD [Bacteriovoracaceae bacterium]|nr:biopolymer transporter ExbD [Bacteriovoracaceae bacterium]
MSRLRGKKDLNSELNLTPLVDLFSTIVCFLLIAAVWVQVSALEVKQSYGTKGAPSKVQNYELNIKYVNANNIRAEFKRGRRKRVVKATGADFDLALVDLNAKIKGWIEKNKKAVIAAAFIKPKRSIDYGQLVSTMDVLRQNNLSNIGIVKIGDR